jgi:hypothetical protein
MWGSVLLGGLSVIGFEPFAFIFQFLNIRIITRSDSKKAWYVREWGL